MTIKVDDIVRTKIGHPHPIDLSYPVVSCWGRIHHLSTYRIWIENHGFPREAQWLSRRHGEEIKVLPNLKGRVLLVFREEFGHPKEWVKALVHLECGGLATIRDTSLEVLFNDPEKNIVFPFRE